MFRNWRLFVSLAVYCGSTVLGGFSFGQLYKPRIGFDTLQAEYGAALHNGAGIRVFMPEALSSGNYMPNSNNAQFSGKLITNGTKPLNTGFSGHATNVGLHLFGNTNSIAPGITNITGASADDFVNRYTGFSTGRAPMLQGFHVTNHSYIGTVSDAATKTNLLRRFDFIISRDNTIAVVGANNNATNTAPDLWTHSYNAITVGRSDGLHSFGTTTVYGAGRTVPEIVVPMQDTGFNFTSYATPVVGASAAILQQAAGFDSSGKALPGGQNQVVRSLLFAGATKDEFPAWNKTSTRPIDSTFGFGELNIYNSYKMLEAGQFEATSLPGFGSKTMGDKGWDYGTFSGTDLYYNFEIKPGQALSELSAVLAWNVDVFNTNDSDRIFAPSHQLSNLELELFNSSGTFLNSLVQASVSTAYNYEHIYLNSPLDTGMYTFRIRGDLPVNYGLAWRMSFDFARAPEPSSFVLLGLTLVVWRPRKRSSSR